MRRAYSSNLGDIGVSKAIYEFTKRNIPCSIPMSENLGYDLIIDIFGKLYKIQIKTRSTLKNGKFHVEICRNNAFTGEHFSYDNDDVDYFFLYCMESDIVVLFPYSKAIGRKTVTFRFKEDLPLNNQINDINYIEDYDIDLILGQLA